MENSLTLNRHEQERLSELLDQLNEYLEEKMNKKNKGEEISAADRTQLARMRLDSENFLILMEKADSSQPQDSDRLRAIPTTRSGRAI